MSKNNSKKQGQSKSKKPTLFKDQRDMLYQATHAIKFAALLTLRNQGWGATRLTRFSEKFDVLLDDISYRRLTFEDITKTLEEETGLNYKDFLIKTGE